jgi:hypothetical protein
VSLILTTGVMPWVCASIPLFPLGQSAFPAGVAAVLIMAVVGMGLTVSFGRLLAMAARRGTVGPVRSS